MMFLTAPVFCTNLEFLFIYLGEVCTFAVALHILLLTVSLMNEEHEKDSDVSELENRHIF